jgi:predicted 3-demethylubiquinone-9 3-methyltransferase (glyoxalase superfamily)
MLASWQKTAEKNRMKKINPFLWFDSEVEEATKFYVGIFKNSKITDHACFPRQSPAASANSI